MITTQVQNQAIDIYNQPLHARVEAKTFRTNRLTLTDLGAKSS